MSPAVRWRDCAVGWIAAPVIFVVTVLLLTALIGGWSSGNRIDPALTVPFMLFGAATACLWWPIGSARWRVVFGAGTLLTAVCGALSLGLAGSVPVGQLALTWVCAVLALLLAMMVRGWVVRRRSSIIRIGIVILLVVPTGVAWARGTNMLLDHAYAPPAMRATSPIDVAVLTSLPLGWGGQSINAILGGAANDSPIRTILDRSFALTLVDTIDPATLRGDPVLLLAHPRALSPQALVDMDRWVRGGGRALILADALSRWPAPQPLGDPRNPPITSLLTPLLSHWGLDLDVDVSAGPVTIAPGGQRLNLAGTGRFRASNASCHLYQDGRMADCRLGQGRVILIADADLIHEAMWQGDPPLGANPAYWSADTPRWLVETLWMLAVGDAAAARSLLSPVWR